MANKMLMLNVRGKRKSWSFPVYVDPQYIPEWREDGLEVFEAENTIPAWAVDYGLVRPWCFLQDIINLKNPFR